MRVLHHFWLSSGSRFARIMLAERKLDFLPKLEEYWLRKDDFLRINIAGSVPVLVEDDGTVLTGTYAIAEYFEDIMPETSLLAGSPAARAEIRRLFAWFSSKAEREIVRPLVHERFISRVTNNGVPSSGVIRSAHDNLSIHLEYINYLAERRPWLAGAKISIADLHAAASLSVLDFMDDVDWESWPEAKTWYSRIKSRPCFRQLLNDQVVGITPPPHYADLDF